LGGDLWVPFFGELNSLATQAWGRGGNGRENGFFNRRVA